MPRHSRNPRHRLLLEPGDFERETLVVPREEAQHAVRVKRVDIDDLVTLLDGAGRMATGEVTAVRPELVVRVLDTTVVKRVTPRVEIWSATPKGPRLEDMIEQLSQTGAALWRPLETDLGVVEPGDGKLDRCRRVARESSKQCGRAWLLEIGEGATFDEATTAAPGTTVVVADADGEAWTACESPCVRVLVGPEGGFTDAERERMRAAGVQSLKLGPHIMRIETAAVCAAARVIGS